ncbi:MAG: PqqD family protein [Rhizomicrobium sp.]|jgi:hypothetical protein
MAMIVRRQADWVVAKVGDEAVMMSVRRDKNIGLNEVGVQIWEAIETPRSVDEICRLLMMRFDVTPEICRVEVERFLGELRDNGAVEFDSRQVA